MHIRSAMGRVRDLSKNGLNSILLGRELKTLRRHLRGGSRPKALTMERLVRSWSNDAWSANGQFLAAILEWFAKSTGTVLECGSGLSTLVLAEACAASKPHRELLTLEHEPLWVERVQSAARRYLGARVNIATAPLQSYGEFDWYAFQGSGLPSPIGFVVCDGPPGFTRGGRYGFGPVLKSYLASDCIVLLDDAQRDDEKAIIKRWREELGAVILEEASTYAVLKIPGSSSIADSATRATA